MNINLFGMKLGHSKLDEQGEENPIGKDYIITPIMEYFYSYMNPLISLGSRKPLELSDVPAMPAYQASEVTQRALSDAWETEMRINANPKLLTALFRAFGHLFLYGAMNASVFVTVVTVQPYLVTRLLEYISSRDAPIFGISSGLGIAFTLGLLSILGAYTINNAMYLLYCFGMAIRSALIGIIFKKSLNISNSAKAKHSIGEIITLMSVDVERVWLACLLMVWLGMSPILSVVAVVLLYLEMGYSSLIIGFFLVVVMYFQEVVSKRIGNTRVELVKHTVQRTKLTNEALQGIRVVKMYAWEKTIEERINEVREKEVTLLRKYLMLKITNTVLPFLAPVIMTYLLFMGYSLMGGEMTIKKIYAGLAILNITRLPMAVFPLARTAAAEATRALTRLRTFLLLPEMPALVTRSLGDTEERPEGEQKGSQHSPFHNDKSAQTTNDTNCLVYISNASFMWSESVDKSDSAATKISSDDADKVSGKSYDKVSSHPVEKEVELRATLPSEKSVEAEDVKSGYTLTNVNLTICRGELVAIVGGVGSGKSSLISAILQQIHRVTGEQFLRGRVAYVSQDHWIQNKTVRDNVLFFSDMDEETYMDTMDASQLSRDLVMLPSADYTEIGERGINLSGGQKARVNIARAVYAKNTDLYLFDDPLAAVDAHVGRAVFQHAILEKLSDKARVVAFSSNYHLLKHFDKVIVVHGRDGNVDICNSYDELRTSYPQYSHSDDDEDDSNDDGEVSAAGNGEAAELADLEFEEELPESKEDPEIGTAGEEVQRVDSIYRKRQRSIEERQEVGKSALISEEDRERGSVTFETFHKYYSAALENRNGTVTFVSILCLFALAQAFRVLNDLWIGIWATDSERSEHSQSQSFYMTMFSMFLVVTCIFVVWRSYFFLSTCIGASCNLHKQILSSVLAAPINKYFDVTPIGRVLNRFTKDMDAVDSLLPDFFLTALQSGFHVISVLILCVFSTPYFVIVLVPLSGMFYLIQEHFRKTSRELKRLDGTSRSPIYNHFGELLAGLATIRAYMKQGTFLKNHHTLCDVNKKCFFAFNVTNRWLSLRLDIISTFVILSVALIAVIMVDLGSPVDHNILGLSIVYAIQLGGMLQWTVRTVIETENNLTSVERLLAFNNIDSESQQTDENVPNLDDKWPSDGRMTIKNMSLRYREGLPLVLSGVDLDIPGGCKVGICGRTGAGKSSVVGAILRLVEPEVGSSLEIDGVDVLKTSLFRLRSQITVIPQDPYMFSGTLRYNLDPFDKYSDSEIWEALERTHLKEDVIEKFPDKLNHEVSERGENISVGQRQLLCIARALLRKSKIIIMDEATASVDTHTDQKIQSTIRSEFLHCTVLTIAHRLDTIIDYDMVVVMEAGRVAESGSPGELLRRPDSMFSDLVEELGSDVKSKFMRVLSEK